MSNALGRMFKEADEGLARYRNIIGVGVIIMLIVFTGTFLYTYAREKEIAASCGFENEKIKCVCNKDAWEWYKLQQEEIQNPYRSLEVPNISEQSS